MVFVPYRGFISNYNSIEYDAKKTLQSFRPLSGFLFSNELAVLVDVYMPSIVSVPYQGFYFLMSADIATYGMGKFVVSVPFRGFYFLNITSDDVTAKSEDILFPSPFGVFIF